MIDFFFWSPLYPINATFSGVITFILVNKVDFSRLALLSNSVAVGPGHYTDILTFVFLISFLTASENDNTNDLLA